jgi:uncharacterized protein
MPLPIPLYPAARPLEIGDRELLHGHFQRLQPTVSELSFANLFLFREVHCYTITSLNDSLVVLGCGYDRGQYVLPPLSGDRGETARMLLEMGNVLYGADEQFVADHLADRGYEASSDRDNDDYLYLRSELAELPGNRFHKKKNRINYFTTRYSYTVEPFSRTHLGAALQLLEKWQKVHDDGASRSQSAEAAATREALEHAEELGLSGVVVLTERGVSAFALGEQLNDSTNVCHFEKADPFLEGLSQLVNREYSRSLPEDLTYINREQDLGENGLRSAKISYHPVAMVRKFRVSVAGTGPADASLRVS